MSHNAEKLKGETLWGFSTSILTQNSSKKLKGGPFAENFFSKKKSRSAEKNERGDPLVSLRMVCYAEEQEKPFGFSSLGQIVQFGEIIFCRTFKNYFGQFVWIEKKSHYNSRISFHEVLTKNTVRKEDWEYFEDKKKTKIAAFHFFQNDKFGHFLEKVFYILTQENHQVEGSLLLLLSLKILTSTENWNTNKFVMRHQ